MKRFSLMVFLTGTALAGAGQAVQGQQLTIESIFSPNAITGRAPDTFNWSPDGKKVSYFVHQESADSAKPGEQGARAADKAGLYAIDASTGQSAVLVPAEKIAAMTPRASGGKDDRERDNRARYRVAAYRWAPDSQHILFDANGQLWYYSLATGTSVQVTASADSAGDPKFSPDGKRLTYIHNHNLVVVPVEGGSETALTNDKGDDLLDGEVDWVYAEELAVRSNYFWSPDSSKIVFMQMNEAKVPTYPITDFIPQHPTVSQEKYPKVGDPNPEVRLGVIAGNGGRVKWLHLTDDKDKDIYIPRFGWVHDGVVWATVLNRAQNRLDLYFVDVNSGKSRKVLSETSDTWIETNDLITFLKAGDSFLWPSWRDGHTHLYLYSFDKANPLGSDARLQNQVTKGDFEVDSVEGVDDAAGTVYVGANAGDAREQHLCSVKLDGSNFRVLTQSMAGTHTPHMSPDAKYYVDAFSALMTPPQLAFCRTGQPDARLELRQGFGPRPSGYVSEQEALKDHDGKLPPNTVMLRGTTGRPEDGERLFIVATTPVVTGADVRTTEVTDDWKGRPEVTVHLNAAGANRLASFTAAHNESIHNEPGSDPNHYLAVVLGDRVREFASIKTEIQGEFVITGTFTDQSARDLAATLRLNSKTPSPSRCDVIWKSKSLDAYHLVPPQFVDFNAEDGTVLHGLIYLPPDSTGKKVPLLNNPYGGPLGQSVRNAWGGQGMLFNQVLLHDGIAVLEVDNRGMGGRGKKFSAALMHNFGEVELKDQLAAIDQALLKFPQLDGTRLGWWGWSYGGFMTLFAMTHSDRFVAGVSVAPVTDWHDYDSIYTERYEGLIPENEAGYKKSSPVNFAEQLHGHLLEVHGTSDDNVHMQNTMQMINSFINAGKQFDLQLYPRKTHGIAGQQARVHLYTRIREHFRRELLSVQTSVMRNGAVADVVAGAVPGGAASSTTGTVPAGAVRVSPTVMEGGVLHRVEPVYPQMAKIAHIQGDVIVETTIDKQGNVEQVRAIQGHPVLIQAALDAVKQWTFKPFQLNGEPLNVLTTITVHFRM